MAHEVQHMNIRKVAFSYLLISTEKHLIKKNPSLMPILDGFYKKNPQFLLKNYIFELFYFMILSFSRDIGTQLLMSRTQSQASQGWDKSDSTPGSNKAANFYDLIWKTSLFRLLNFKNFKWVWLLFTAFVDRAASAEIGLKKCFWKPNIWMPIW